MLLIYRGAHPEVYVLDGNDEVPLRDPKGNRIEEARQGEPVEVPDEVAKNLLAQGTWDRASAAPVNTKPSAPLAQGTGA